jgi:ATP-binding cassette subfamily B protein
VVRSLLVSPADARRAWAAVAAASAAVVVSFAARSWSFHVSHLAAFDHEVILRRMLVEQLGRLPLGVVQRIGSGALKKVV